MKKLILSAAFLPLLVFTSCDALKDKVAVKFDVPYSSEVAVKGLPGNPTIPSTGMKLTLFSTAEATKSDEYIKQNNTSSELLQEAKLSELKLEMKAPENQNFDLVDSIWVYLSATGMTEIKAAYKYDIPKNTKSIEMNLEDINVKDYFLKDSIFLRVEGHFYKSLDTNTIMNISGKLSAVANPLEK